VGVIPPMVGYHLPYPGSLNELVLQEQIR